MRSFKLVIFPSSDASPYDKTIPAPPPGKSYTLNLPEARMVVSHLRKAREGASVWDVRALNGLIDALEGSGV